MSIPIPKRAEKGSRKVQHAREQSLLLMLGFVVASWMKAPVDLFVAFVVGLTGLSGAFVWGNRAEHAKAPVLPEPPAPAVNTTAIQ